MNIKKLIAAAFLLTNACLTTQAQTVADTTEIKVKAISHPPAETVLLDSVGNYWTKANRKQKNVKTSWFDGLDFGFSNYVDNTNYSNADAQAYAPGSNAGWFDLRNGKSVNVNLWIFNQKINLVKHIVNLKYALGLELNNYRYKNNIRYNAHPAMVSNPAIVSFDNTAGRSYKKNKLAADYITMPVMLNFNFTPHKAIHVKTNNNKIKITKELNEYGFSFGMSLGYLYSSRNKTITSDEGKLKAKDDFDLNKWKVSAVGEINLGPVSLYGSYALTGMYNRGLNFTPYTIGIRL